MLNETRIAIHAFESGNKLVIIICSEAVSISYFFCFFSATAFQVDELFNLANICPLFNQRFEGVPESLPFSRALSSKVRDFKFWKFDTRLLL